MQDWEALQKFVEARSDEAFRCLVERHFNMVWATAYRLTGNHARAADVAQEVFTDLAKRAPRIGPKVVLPGWLYRAACFAAKNSNRREMRRSKHEREAQSWHESKGHDVNPEDQQLIANLDDALSKLSERDRNILLQRFFGKKRVQDIADDTGISRAAAQKQISRALDRLRTWYRQRGLAPSHSSLIAGLTLLGSQTAPAGLAAQIATQTAAIATATTPWWLSTAETTLEFMTIKKPILVGSLALAGISAPLIVQELRIRDLKSEQSSQNQHLEQLSDVSQEHQAWQETQNEISEFEKLEQASLERDELKTELDKLKQQGAEEKAEKLALIDQLAANLSEQEEALDEIEARRQFEQVSLTTMSAGKDLALPLFMYALSHDQNLPRSLQDIESQISDKLEHQDDGSVDFMGLPLESWQLIQHEGKLSDYNQGSLLLLRERETRFFEGEHHRVYAFGDGHSEMVSRAQLTDFDKFEAEQFEKAQKQ